MPLAAQLAGDANHPDTQDGMIGRIVGSIGNFLGGGDDGSAPRVTIPLKAPSFSGGADTDGGGDSRGFTGWLKEMFPDSPDGGDAGGGRELAAPRLPSANDRNFHPPALSPIPVPHPNTWAVTPPAQSAPPDPFLPALDGLGDGVKSYARGLDHAGDAVFDAMGATNAQAMASSRRANGVLADVVGQAVTHPRQTMDLMRKLAPLAADYTGENKGRVAGRLGTGLGVSAAINPYAGGALSAVAAYGDIIHAIRNGASTEEEIMQAILGGAYPGQP